VIWSVGIGVVLAVEGDVGLIVRSKTSPQIVLLALFTTGLVRKKHLCYDSDCI
jgi:hypothetical protein